MKDTNILHCKYQYYISLLQLAKDHCSQGCLADINCCLTSSPCYNAGTCLPNTPRNEERFTCKCPHAYEGQRCEKKRCNPGYKGKNCMEPITSCLGYKDGNLKPGKYTIIDNTGNPYQAFCQFSQNGYFAIAWTLIQSYTLENKDKFNKSLIFDYPVNQNHPSWIEYRLSKTRMDYIVNNSNIFWRITCNYNSDGLSGSDFVRARVVEAPLLINASENCFEVEHIVVRGHKCANCKAYMVNDGKRALYFDPKLSNENCDLKLANITMCGNEAENSFGYYHCVNPVHQCSSSPSSTTQLWLGGDM